MKIYPRLYPIYPRLLQRQSTARSTNIQEKRSSLNIHFKMAFQLCISHRLGMRSCFLLNAAHNNGLIRYYGLNFKYKLLCLNIILCKTKSPKGIYNFYFDHFITFIDIKADSPPPHHSPDSERFITNTDDGKAEHLIELKPKM